MEQLAKYFPLNNKVEKGNVASLVIAIVIYLIAPSIAGIIVGLLSFIPLVGSILGLVSSLFGIYCLVGLIFAIIKYVK
jgi:uncharacterized Tic20 family protein